MLLGLLRDRGALVMSFFLPPAIFLIFAAVFANAGGDRLALTVAIADELGSAASVRVTAGLAASERFRVVGGRTTAADVRRMVAAGEADAGLVIRRDGATLDRLGDDAPPPFVIVTDATRQVAALMLMAELRRIYYVALPEAAFANILDFVARRIVPLSDEQRARAAVALRRMGEQAEGDRAASSSFEALFQREAASSLAARDPVSYYAGAVAVLFLLLAAMHGGSSLLEERESGVIDRIAATPGGIGVFVDGKFAFITLLGTAQVTLIFAVAWVVHGVSLAGKLLPWGLVTVAAAAAAAGLALLLAAVCTSRRQASSLGNFLVLVLSAVGGSMVPRFLMPGWLRDAGWATPNTWALEAYDAVVRRGESLSALTVPMAVLCATGLLGWAAARIVSARRERMT